MSEIDVSSHHRWKDIAAGCGVWRGRWTGLAFCAAAAPSPCALACARHRGLGRRGDGPLFGCSRWLFDRVREEVAGHGVIIEAVIPSMPCEAARASDERVESRHGYQVKGRRYLRR